MRIRRFALLLAALALASAGASAGVALGSPTGASPIEKAATKSSKSSSVKFNFTVSISGGGASIPGGKITLGGTGAVDTKHKAADFKLDLSTLAPLLSGVTNGAAVPSSIELVVVNNVVYLDFPALAKQLGAPSKQWVKIDLSKLPKSTTGGVDPKAAANVSPQQALTALRSSLSVHKVGSDRYGTHYRASLHLSSLVSLVPKSEQTSLKSSLSKAGIKTVPFDAWVGKQGFLTRFTTSLAVKAQAGQPAVKIGLTLGLHDYGHKVTVSAPPASQTVDGSKLLSSLSSITGG